MLFVRQITLTDEPFLWQMLGEAAHWRGDPYIVPDLPNLAHLAKYLAGWGRPGDAGVIAEVNGQPVGAAWYRLFLADDHGYGFINEGIPELSIGVLPQWRGKGIGARLLASLEEKARDSGYVALSLSVEETNPANRLYARRGYVQVDKVGGAWTMLKDLSTPDSTTMSGFS
jgi:GNAT superfamily N-acetyltransferase